LYNLLRNSYQYGEVVTSLDFDFLVITPRIDRKRQLKEEMVRNGAASDGSEVGVDPPAGASPWTSPTKPEADTQEATPLVHKVNIPPNNGLVNDVTGPIKEIFFYDESLRQFKNQTPGKRAFLLLKHVVPILDWLPRYKPRWFPSDLVAGLTIASLAVPQDLGYAKLAGLPPVYGLYSSFVPPLIYAALGSSRHIAIGPVAVVSILLGTLLQNEIPNINDPNYLRLAFTANFFAGVVQAAVGFIRLGFVIYFLSHATIVGFMAGAAITIGLQQLKGLLGLTNFTKKTGIVPVLRSVFSQTKQVIHKLLSPAPLQFFLLEIWGKGV
jgi:high affinity sulfate transporter 1